VMVMDSHLINQNLISAAVLSPLAEIAPIFHKDPTLHS